MAFQNNVKTYLVFDGSHFLTHRKNFKAKKFSPRHKALLSFFERNLYTAENFLDSF